MPIEIQCEHCKRKLRISEQFAGKRGKCPNCREPIDIPSLAEGAGEGATTSAEKAAKEPAKSSSPEKPAGKSTPKDPAKAEVDKEEWYMKTEEGDDYGPVTRAEMDAWVEDGRVDATCHLLREGWQDWKWAEEIYPQLRGESPTEENVAEQNPAEEAGTGFDLEALTGGGTESDATVADDPLAGIGYDAPPSGASKTSGKTTKSSVVGKSSREKQSESEPKVELVQEDKDGGLSARAKKALIETRPWVKTLAILLFVMAGLIALGASGVVLTALKSFSTSALLGTLFLFGAMVEFALAGGFGFIGYYLFQYGSQLNKYLGRGKTADLESALTAQQTVWKFLCIIFAVLLGIGLLAFIVLIVVAVVGALAATGGRPRR